MLSTDLSERALCTTVICRFYIGCNKFVNFLSHLNIIYNSLSRCVHTIFLNVCWWSFASCLVVVCIFSFSLSLCLAITNVIFWSALFLYFLAHISIPKGRQVMGYPINSKTVMFYLFWRISKFGIVLQLGPPSWRDPNMFLQSPTFHHFASTLFQLMYWFKFV